MASQKLICIECPKGCELTVDLKDGKVIAVSGNQCPKGEHYAKAEIEAPVRVLTSSVSTVGLECPMIPVRTDQPIPKERIFEAMQEIIAFRCSSAIKAGEILIPNFLDLGVNLIATRTVHTTSQEGQSISQERP